MISVRRPSPDFVGDRVSSPLRAVPSTPTNRGKKPRRPPAFCPEPQQCPGHPERRSIRRSPLRRPGGYPIRWPIFRRHRNRATELPLVGPSKRPMIVFAPRFSPTSPKGLARRAPRFRAPGRACRPKPAQQCRACIRPRPQQPSDRPAPGGAGAHTPRRSPLCGGHPLGGLGTQPPPRRTPSKQSSPEGSSPKPAASRPPPNERSPPPTYLRTSGHRLGGLGT
jgi:hypothetical protein